MKILRLISLFSIFQANIYSSYSTKISGYIEMGNNISKTCDKDVFNYPSLDILFYESVTDQSCKILTQSLNKYDEISKAISISYPEQEKIPISLHIQSYGGMLMPVFYVCDVMKNLDTPVHTYIDGYAASAATLMSVCGDKRYITRFSRMLIHQLSTGHKGKSSEIEDQMENMLLLMDDIRKIYLENTKLELDELDKLLRRDLWLNSSRCLEYGLVDEIL